MTAKATIGRLKTMTSDSANSHSGNSLIWALLATVLVAASDPWRLAGTVAILDRPEQSELAPEWAWSPPLSNWDLTNPLSTAPGWVFCVLAGALISHAVTKAARRSSLEVASILGGGLALGIEPRDVLPAVCLAIVSYFHKSAYCRRGLPQASIGWLLVSGASLALTLEFGLIVWIVLLLAIEDRLSKDGWSASSGHRSWWPMALLLAFAGFTQLHPGVRAAFWRPVSWMWLRPESAMMPSLSPAFSQGDRFWGDALLATYLAVAWWTWLRRSDRFGAPKAWLVIGTILGLCCGRYLVLVAYALAVTDETAVVDAKRPAWHGRLVLAGGVLSVVAMLAAQAGIYTQWFYAGSPPPRSVDLSGWGISGPVLLFNLDQSTDWASRPSTAKLPLLLNDRWDLFGADYPGYARVCRDLSEVRHESYRLENGQWGGYRAQFRSWNPSLVVVDSLRIDDIRSMSLSPDLRLLSIDGSQTILGAAENPAVALRSAVAIGILTRLEWPIQPVLDPGVIAAPTAEDQTNVAEVLTAIRLPYASLRLLPDSHDDAIHRQRTWSYLELAHRCRRYSGGVSLLDQYRGVSLALEGLQGGLWNDWERRRLATCFDSLELPELAAQFSPRVSEETSLESRSVSASDPAPPPEELSTDFDQSSRLALLTGDGDQARSSIQRHPSPAAAVLSVLSRSETLSAVEVYHQLDATMRESQISDVERSEFEFYLGCLAIEAGDASSARHWLLESQRHDPSSGFAPLVRMYFGQLGNP